MSAWTSAQLYRPGPPPVVTTNMLADFLERLLALDLHNDACTMGARLKFGKAIDQDQKGTVIEDDPGAIVTVVRFIDWDSQINTCSVTDLPKWLRSPFKKKGLFARDLINPTIYRAMIDLGAFKEEVFREFSRDNDEANEIGGMWLDNFFFSLGPIETADPQGDGTVYTVGWMGVSASGNGYLWPWTYEEALAKVKSSEPLQRVRELCRSFWPVPPIELTQANIEARKSMGHLWGGDDYDAPPDWRWVVNESY